MEKEKHHILLKILSVSYRTVLLALTFVAAVAEFFALLAPYTVPESMSISCIVTMVEPIIIAANLVLLLLWIILWKFWFVVPLIVLVLSFGRIDSYFSYKLSRDYSQIESKTPPKKQLRVMSYNVRSFGGGNSLDSILATAAKFDPDILCLVEYAPLANIDDKFSSALPKLKFRASNKGIKAKASEVNGIVLFSRYPLINPDKYECFGHGISISADAVLFYGDTIRLVGLHLESTGYNGLSSERELEVYMADSTIDTKGIVGAISCDTTRNILKSRTKSLWSTLSDQSHYRALQADTIRQDIESNHLRTIVMGDFNDTPYSYTVRTIMGDNLQDPFALVPKNKYGFTFNLLHKLFRIDYILPQKNQFEVLDYDSPDLPYSDHNPVMVTLRRSY